MPAVARLPHMDPLHHDFTSRLNVDTSSFSSSSSSNLQAGTSASSSRLPTSQLFATLLQRAGSISHVSRTGTGTDGLSTRADQTQSMKRKLAEDLGADLDITSPSDIVLPKDPTRRVSIIHLATAAAAVVLQGQIAERRFSQQEHINKRQRTREQQLSLLAEQARTTHLIAARARNESASRAKQWEDESPFSWSQQGAAGPSRPSPPAPPLQKASSRQGDVGATAEQDSSRAAATVGDTAIDLSALRSFSIPSDLPPASRAPINLTKPIDNPKHQQGWDATVTSQGFPNEAKFVANHYGRFYRFEQEWAHRALALGASRGLNEEQSHENLAPPPSHIFRQGEARSASPTSEAAPSVSAAPARIEDGAVTVATAAERSSTPGHPPHIVGSGSYQVSPRASPRQRHSQASSRHTSRAASPAAAVAIPALERKTSGKSNSDSNTGSPFGGPSHGLVSVIYNFADLVKARQESCSGLEALARQAQGFPDVAIQAEADRSGADADVDESDESVGSDAGTPQPRPASAPRRRTEIDRVDSGDGSELEQREGASTPSSTRPAEPMSIASMM